MSGVLRLKDKPDLPTIGVRIRGRTDEPEVTYDTAALTAFMTQKFTTSLFQGILGTQPPAAGTGGATPPAGGTAEGAGTAKPAEPKPEEAIVKGIIDLLGGKKKPPEEPPPEEEDDDEGGGGGLLNPSF